LFDFEIIARQAKNNGSAIAYVDEKHRVTFKELDLQTRKIAQTLVGKGVSQGSIVSVALPSYLDWIFTLALHRLGASTFSVTDKTLFTPELIPNWFVGSNQHPQIPLKRTILCDDDYRQEIEESKPLKKFQGYADVEQVARFIATSGTTGDIKYIARTLSEIGKMVKLETFAESFADGPMLSLFPLAAGQAYRVGLKALKSGTTFYRSTYLDVHLPHVLGNAQIQTILGSPIQISLLLDILEKQPTQLPFLKKVIIGGSSPSPQIVSRIKRVLNCDIINTYGSTEAGNVSYQVLPEEAESGANISVHASIQIVDEGDKPLPPNSIGVIRYKRKGMATSYYRRPDLTKTYFRNKYFYPGDYGYIDESGRLFLKGRTSEILNIGGVKINPEDIEKFANQQVGVLDCAAFTGMSESGIEHLAIAVVPGVSFQLESFAAIMVSHYPNLDGNAFFVTKIPRNTNGKILRMQILLEYEKALRRSS